MLLAHNAQLKGIMEYHLEQSPTRGEHVESGASFPHTFQFHLFHDGLVQGQAHGQFSFSKMDPTSRSRSEGCCPSA
jgi:hypothetical protein